jgi:type II secretory pathway pseudopilin PulG
MNRRRGISLIEMIAVMGIGAVMMGVAVTLLYTLLRTEGSGREHVRQSSVLGRLADQFRRDVHAAKTVAAAPDGEGRQFELAPGQTVTYRFQRGTLTRTEQVDGTPQRRESYALPPGTTATIRIPADTQPALVSLMITPVAEASGPAGGRAIHIDAVLARDHRFAKAEEP